MKKVYTKLTVEIQRPEGKVQKITIEENSCSHDLHDFLCRIVKPLLVSIGFDDSDIQEYLKEDK